MASEVLKQFTFREFEAGPRRDTARRFAELAADLDQELGGDSPEKDETMHELLTARDAFVDFAGSLLRSNRPK